MLQNKLVEKIPENRDVTELLCQPQPLIELLELCIAGESHRPLAEIVLQDTALTVKILHAASKTAGVSLNPSEPLSSAIDQLGLPVITGIALHSARQLVETSLEPDELRFQYQLWLSSQAGGQAACCLAPAVNYPHIEEAQLCGLLLNLGIQLLFRRHRRDYLQPQVTAWSDPEQCRWEDAQYRTDHLRFVEPLIDQWQLDSFLADAIRFLHADPEQLAQSGMLLKIGRFAHQFYYSPQQLSAETVALAEQLFGLKKSEIDYLFTWTRGLCPSFDEIITDGQGLQERFSAARQQLTQLIFAMAEREAARSRLAAAESPSELATIARSWYLENSSSSEMLLFFVDEQNRKLNGVPCHGSHRMLSDIRIPLDVGACLATRALLREEQQNSFNPSQPLTVTDLLLLRLCRSRAFGCQVFKHQGRPLGVALLGLHEHPDLDSLQTPPIKMFNGLLSRAIQRFQAVDQQGQAAEGRLLRRISQELSSPLTVIGNYAEVLNQSIPDEELRKLTRSIRQEVRHIDDAIGYYLNQQELPDFPVHRIKLNSLLAETVDKLKEQELAHEPIRLSFTANEGLEEIATNPVQLQTVLNELVLFSASQLANGGTIQLSTQETYLAGRGRCLEIIIADDGPGLSSRQQENLLQPTGSLEIRQDKRIGQLVEELGGQLNCYSSAEAGTRFQLRIPCR